MSSSLHKNSQPSSTASPAWKALAHAESTSADTLNIRAMLADDGERHSRYSVTAAGLVLDYSKNLLSDSIRDALHALAQTAGMDAAIAAMFRGDAINNTEQRPALHVALRSPHKETEYEKLVHSVLERIEDFTAKVLSGEWTGFDGRPISDVVNIGIGGSDLGPAMVYEALTPFHQPGLSCHFVSNVDPVHLEQTLKHLDPATTLVIIASKTFTTLETMLNAGAARRWMLQAGAEEADLARHFVAVSANVSKAEAFGIDAVNVFPLWDWVGGRYSLWSAIGLPVALGTGIGNFRALLSGANAMDEHFRTAPLQQNMPVIMALLNIWYSNFMGAESQVVLPYAQNLHLFPAFLQQLDMESLGKQVSKSGDTLAVASGGIVWGSAGTNGQHSFHQLLHQGTHLIPADFIAVAQSASGNREQHEQLLANCFAQSQALMDGKSLDEAVAELQARGMPEADVAALAPHKVVPGNRPSNTLLLKQLNPESLGALIALYEHKVYAHSIILGINAFDQWGVELGKVLSTDIYRAITSDSSCKIFDASTNALINSIREHADRSNDET